jgi:membrane protease YdiL (CAAX protease family)
LRVGAGYIYIDLAECTGCFACVEACERGAIVRRSAPTRPTATQVVAPGEVAKVVVGSRAEAKALRAAAEHAQRDREKASRAGATPAAGGRPEAGMQGGTGVVWSSLEAAAVAGLLLAALVAKEVVLDSAYVTLMPASGRLFARTAVLGTFYAVQLVLLAWLAQRRGLPARDVFRLRLGGGSVSAGATAAGLVALLLLGTRAASTAWGALAQALGWAPPASESLTGIFGRGGPGMALTVAMVVIVAPFAEELAFRAVIAGAIDARLGRRAALYGSAALFALYHFTAWALVPTFVLGMALGWLALTRRTLWPAIALHVLYNGVVVAAAFALPHAT